jgi:Co/Zn/Cd efflux system component
MENIVIFGISLAALSVCEGIIGANTQNVHIIRDFMIAALLVLALYISNRAIQVSKNQPDSTFTFGYRRMNILAAFCNCIYI